MAIFELIVDNRVEIWRRDKVIVEAENLEEAISRAESGYYNEVDDAEYLCDTEVYLKPEEVDGFPTCEVMDSSGKTLWNNGSR